MEITRIRLAGTNAVLTFTTLLGRTYQVQRSSNLIDWSVLADHIAGSGGAVQVTDSGVGTVRHRFYRVRQLP